MTAPVVPVGQPRDVPRVIWSWAFYDWANSAFTTLVVTFIYSYYFTQALAPDGITGTTWWSRGIGLSAVLVALLSPIMGAAADRGGTRKRFLAVATGICVLGSVTLTFIAPGMANAALLALIVFVVANVAFETSMVFYNAFLPTIASPEKIGENGFNARAPNPGGGLVRGVQPAPVLQCAGAPHRRQGGDGRAGGPSV